MVIPAFHGHGRAVLAGPVRQLEKGISRLVGPLDLGAEGAGQDESGGGDEGGFQGSSGQAFWFRERMSITHIRRADQ